MTRENQSTLRSWQRFYALDRLLTQKFYQEGEPDKDLYNRYQRILDMVASSPKHPDEFYQSVSDKLRALALNMGLRLGELTDSSLLVSWNDEIEDMAYNYEEHLEQEKLKMEYEIDELKPKREVFTVAVGVVLTEELEEVKREIEKLENLTDEETVERSLEFQFDCSPQILSDFLLWDLFPTIPIMRKSGKIKIGDNTLRGYNKLAINEFRRYFEGKRKQSQGP